MKMKVNVVKVINSQTLDLDYLVLNNLTHYTTSVLEEVVHTPFNMFVSNIFSDQVLHF